MFGHRRFPAKADVDRAPAPVIGTANSSTGAAARSLDPSAAALISQLLASAELAVIGSADES